MINKFVYHDIRYLPRVLMFAAYSGTFGYVTEVVVTSATFAYVAFVVAHYLRGHYKLHHSASIAAFVVAFMVSDIPGVAIIFSHSSTFLDRVWSCTLSIARLSLTQSLARVRASIASSCFLLMSFGSSMDNVGLLCSMKEDKEVRSPSDAVELGLVLVTDPFKTKASLNSSHPDSRGPESLLTSLGTDLSV